MAQRKKRPAVRKGKSIARRKARKPSKSARGRPAKRTVARAIPRKRLAKATLKRAAKKGRKKVRAMKPPAAPAVETVTEIEATEVREADAGPEEESSVSTPGIRRTLRIASPVRHWHDRSRVFSVASLPVISCVQIASLRLPYCLAGYDLRRSILLKPSHDLRRRSAKLARST